PMTATVINPTKLRFTFSPSFSGRCCAGQDSIKSCRDSRSSNQKSSRTKRYSSRLMGNSGPRPSRRKGIMRDVRAPWRIGIRLQAMSALTVLLLATSCAGSGGSPGPNPTPTPTGSARSLPALQLAVLVAVGGHLDYCDPDLYPVGRGTPLENAQARFPTIQADQAAFQAILQQEHLSAGQQFTPAELITINERYKQMQAIRLEPTAKA